MEKLLGKQNKLTRISMLVFYDMFAIGIAQFAALYIRFEFRISEIPGEYLHGAERYVVVNIVTAIVIFAYFQLYESLWKYASVSEMCSAVLACMTSAAVQSLGMLILHISMPVSYHILYLFLLLTGILGGRFAYRFIRMLRMTKRAGERKQPVRAMLIGAGEAGRAIVKEMKYSDHLNYQPCCIFDDDTSLAGRRIYGVPIAGPRENICEMVNKYDIQEIFITIPSLNMEEKKKIIELCRQTSCKLKILPGTYQLINEEVNISKLRDVQIEDLLGRDPINVCPDEILGYVQDKVVLVTGGGGSIGSELCRQLAGHGVRQLIIFDMYENNAYSIQQELKGEYPDLDLQVLIGSVRNTNRLASVFCSYRPDIVYHAAAHKHVPLMEDSPNEAVKNNVMGTYKTAMMADKYRAEKFILISTDKAVNPTNIMGASKRLCEMVIQMFDRQSRTDFVAVRFGNVLGSNGSVIPLFREQIKKGGPVTVTHPEIIRYFMTIPEAVSLVLQAGAYAKGGEIFVLDMGEPVKILDLAKNLIRLSGYEPERDIKITFTGLRPGEKLYEELLMEEEGIRKTANDRIFIGHPISMDHERFAELLHRLDDAAWGENSNIRELVHEAVPEYCYETDKKKEEHDEKQNKTDNENSVDPGQRNMCRLVSPVYQK
ncbi:nucleoside-diphosphate sugar epimerase/dehydratase [Blautia pseudococcoides]|uniref:nucleoside-diphosphate sugar epimerase/dehydratase n=1 Tax=Blautia pseudococcoides TaxID=1796616 RepID=UPI00148AED81|nr:polysaccharide biosynthesis protein [Blautia pseudococcoides]